MNSLIGSCCGEMIHNSGRPVNHGAVDGSILPEAEMHGERILNAVSFTRTYFTLLRSPRTINFYNSADAVAIALNTLQEKFNPVIGVAIVRRIIHPQTICAVGWPLVNITIARVKIEESI